MKLHDNAGINPITPEKLAELRCSNWRATVAALDEEGYPREAQEWGHDLEEFMRQRYALPDLLDEIERLREALERIAEGEGLRDGEWTSVKIAREALGK